MMSQRERDQAKFDAYFRDLEEFRREREESGYYD